MNAQNSIRISDLNFFSSQFIFEQLKSASLMFSDRSAQIKKKGYQIQCRLAFPPPTLPNKKQHVACDIYLPHSIHTQVYKNFFFSRKWLVKCMRTFKTSLQPYSKFRDKLFRKLNLCCPFNSFPQPPTVRTNSGCLLPKQESSHYCKSDAEVGVQAACV